MRSICHVRVHVVESDMHNICERLEHSNSIKSSECVSKTRAFYIKKSLSNSLDAFKRHIQANRPICRRRFQPLLMNVFLKTKKNFLSFGFCHCAIIFMACAQQLTCTCITSNEVEREREKQRKKCRRHHHQYCCHVVAFIYTRASSIFPSRPDNFDPNTLSLGSRLHFVFVYLCVCIAPRQRSNFPNAWLWILLILSEQVHQFAIHIIVCYALEKCTQEIPKYI